MSGFHSCKVPAAARGTCARSSHLVLVLAHVLADDVTHLPVADTRPHSSDGFLQRLLVHRSFSSQGRHAGTARHVKQQQQGLQSLWALHDADACLCSDPDEVLGFGIHLPHNKGLVQVSMKALIVGRHIHIHNVPVLQRPLVRDAVADNLQCALGAVNAARRCWQQETAVQWRRTVFTSFTEVHTDFGKLW